MLDLLASAAQGFMKGMEQGEDRKYRQMEIEARQRAEDDTRARQRAQDEYNKAKDEAEAQRHNFKLGIELREKGFKTPTLQEGQSLADVDPSTLERDPEYEALQKRLAQNKNAGGYSDPYGLRAMAAAKARDEAEARAKAQTPIGRIEKLSGDQRKRFDDTTGALDALIGIDSAVKKLPSEFGERESQMMDVPLRGGTDFTVARDQFIESLGRLQSGGAITKDEVSNFKKLIPTAFDKPEIAAKKLEDLKFRLSARLKTFGLSPAQAAEAGFLKPETAHGLLRTGMMEDQDNDPLRAQKVQRLQQLRAKKAQGARVANGS